MDPGGKPTKHILDALERQMENMAERAKANRGIIYLFTFLLFIDSSVQYSLSLTSLQIARRRPIRCPSMLQPGTMKYLELLQAAVTMLIWLCIFQRPLLNVLK
jgi:hypothetical protein